MSIISLHYLGGILEILNTPSCGFESSYTQPAIRPVYNSNQKDEYTYEDWIAKRDLLPTYNPRPWKERIITHIAVSDLFISASFFPYNLFDKNNPPIWFVQKNVQKPYHGFYAPFLNEHQEYFGCIKEPDKKYEIKDWDQVYPTIEHLNGELLRQTALLMIYFWNDRETYGISLTYSNYETSCWLKSF